MTLAKRLAALVAILHCGRRRLVPLLFVTVLAMAPIAASSVTSVVAAVPLPTVLASIPIPDFPQFLAVDPSTHRVYIDHAGSNEVSVVDTATRTVVATIQLGDQVTGIAEDPATQRVYAANFFHNTIAVIDQATNLIVGHVDVSFAAIGPGGGAPLLIAANPTTKRVYVALGSGAVAVIDETTDAVVGTILTGGDPTGIAVNSITNQVYAADQALGRVFVIDGATNTLVATVALPLRAGGFDVSVNPVQNRAYAVSANGSEISVIDGATNSLFGTIDRCCFGGTTFDAQTNRLYASNLASHTIDVYDGASDALLGSVPLDATPLYGLGVNPISGELYSTALSFAGGYALLVLGTVDTTPPTISITSPAQGAVYTVHQTVLASYSCTDPDSAVASCTGSVPNGSPIDTTSVGIKTFTVTAADPAGNTSSQSVTYAVAGPSDTTVTGGGAAFIPTGRFAGDRLQVDLTARVDTNSISDGRFHIALYNSSGGVLIDVVGTADCMTAAAGTAIVTGVITQGTDTAFNVDPVGKRESITINVVSQSFALDASYISGHPIGPCTANPIIALVISQGSYAIHPIFVAPQPCALGSGTSLASCDFGFETPVLGDGNFTGGTTGSPWVFSGSSGISSNHSGFTGSQPAPEGVQVAFVQVFGGFAQPITGFVANQKYVLTFSAARRSNFGGANDFVVLLDNKVIGTFKPGSTSYADFSVSLVTSAGTHTLGFFGLDTAGGDNTAFIDNVRIA